MVLNVRGVGYQNVVISYKENILSQDTTSYCVPLWEVGKGFQAQLYMEKYCIMLKG